MQAEGCDRLRDGQISEQAAERASKKKKSHLRSPLSPLPVLFNLGAPWERETDGGSRKQKNAEICQEQSLKTVHDQMIILRSFSSPLSHSILFSLYSIICLRAMTLKAKSC